MEKKSRGPENALCVFVCRHVVRTSVENIAMDCSSVLRMFRICEREPELIDGKKKKKAPVVSSTVGKS